jgi:hypothetical protein
MCYPCRKPSNLQKNYILCSLRRGIDATKFETPMITNKILAQSEPRGDNRTTQSATSGAQYAS